MRLKELREQFDRLVRVGQDHGYSDKLKRDLEELSKQIKQEEIARRFANGSEEVDRRTKSFKAMV